MNDKTTIEPDKREKESSFAIIIPALNPGEELLHYVQKLKDSGFNEIIIINDGSDRNVQLGVFEDLKNDAIVISHIVNKGKGAALKTGYKYVLDNLRFIKGVITVDSDGQHTVEDCEKIANRLEADNSSIYLGVRDFSLPGIPLKSRWGNKLTSILFRLLYGKYLSDTQTGIRAINRELLPFMMNVSGERYEYEMNVLIACTRAGINLISVPIETIYENNNKGTHFRPVRDSIRIYRVLFGNFFKFMGSSLASTIVDQALFNLFNLAVFANGDEKSGGYIFTSTVIARVVSAITNFTLNRNFVFGKNEHGKRSFKRYSILCVGIMILSAMGTWLLSIAGMNSAIAKIVIDTILYIISFRVQNQWVFS